MRTEREDMMALLKLIWRQGIVADYRRQFWRQLVGIYRQNPSRLPNIWKNSAMGENLFPIRENLLAKAGPVRAGKMPPGLTGRRPNGVAAGGGGRRSLASPSPLCAEAAPRRLRTAHLMYKIVSILYSFMTKLC